MEPGTRQPMLRVVDLRTYFFSRFNPPLKAVDGISYEVRPGEMVAIAGESGCGKSVSILSVLRLNPRASSIVSGEALWSGIDLLQASPKEMRLLRGREIGMIFQNPLTSLNPLKTIGTQLSEAFRLHGGLTRRESRQESERMLGLVAVPDVKRKMEAHPFQLSGGMRQRVMIAIALSRGPRLVFADEPTTALDATTQAQILELLSTANREARRATVLVTHDLGIVARYADRVYVMYAGRIVETADCESLYRLPLHPYTAALLRAVPRLDGGSGRKLEAIPGHPPSLDAVGLGCAFGPRCDRAVARCGEERPALRVMSDERAVACWQA